MHGCESSVHRIVTQRHEGKIEFFRQVGIYRKLCFNTSYHNRNQIRLLPVPLKASIKETRNPKTGKPVTVVTGITHNPQVIEKLTKKLKSACGAGGHIEGKTIIIQGSHSVRVSELLSKEGISISS